VIVKPKLQWRCSMWEMPGVWNIHWRKPQATSGVSPRKTEWAKSQGQGCTSLSKLTSWYRMSWTTNMEL
jgi:hypothetical protein